MQTVVATKTIHAPIEDVFEAYPDHERPEQNGVVVTAFQAAR